jgi:hypothetical protein
MDFMRTYEDPSFRDAHREMARITPNAIIEWLKRRGIFDLRNVKKRAPGAGFEIISSLHFGLVLWDWLVDWLAFASVVVMPIRPRHPLPPWTGTPVSRARYGTRGRNI